MSPKYLALKQCKRCFTRALVALNEIEALPLMATDPQTRIGHSFETPSCDII